MGLPKVQKSCCSLIHGSKLILTYETNGYTLTGKDEKILCQNLSTGLEKNWSTWDYNGLKLSYHIVPQHTVFEFTDTQNQCYSRFEPEEENIFVQIESYYKGPLRSALFSCSTPAIPFGNKYLAVGHLKLTPMELPQRPTLGKQRHQELRRFLDGHPSYNTRYFMFFYTFDPETLSILEISHSFIPPGATSNVVFPTGLIMNLDGKIIVSYGEHDDKMKLLFLEPEEVTSMLRTDITPETFDFIRF